MEVSRRSISPVDHRKWPHSQPRLPPNSLYDKTHLPALLSEQSQEREKWFVHTLDQSGLNPAGNWKMASQKFQRFAQQPKRVPLRLALVNKPHLGYAAKACQAQLALRVSRKETLAKRHDRRIQYSPIRAYAEAVEQISRIGGSRSLQATGGYSRACRLSNLLQIEVQQIQLTCRILPPLL
jgi:hypothetical protein